MAQLLSRTGKALSTGPGPLPSPLGHVLLVQLHLLLLDQRPVLPLRSAVLWGWGPALVWSPWRKRTLAQPGGPASQQALLTVSERPTGFIWALPPSAWRPAPSCPRHDLAVTPVLPNPASPATPSPPPLPASASRGTYLDLEDREGKRKEGWEKEKREGRKVRERKKNKGWHGQHEHSSLCSGSSSVFPHRLHLETALTSHHAWGWGRREITAFPPHR